MKGGILSDTGKSAKQIARDAVRKMAGEPFEILKKATGEMISPPVAVSTQQPNPETRPPVSGKNEDEVKKKDLRTVEALNQEIKDIQRNKLIAEIQKRIDLGKTVSFEKYTELPQSQIEILKKQQEQVAERKKYEDQMNKKVLSEAVPKKGRRFSIGRKKAAERESVKTESPLPPSG